MRTILLLLGILVLGCLQPTEAPKETAKPAELPPTASPTLTATPTLATQKTLKPEKPEIKLTFPNGTVEKNGTYFLGEFTENFTLKVEPQDADFYFNGTQLDVTNGNVVLSVDKGGDYEIVVKKDEKEKVYNVFIGHGELKAEWIKTEMTYIFDSNATIATIYPDSTCLAKSSFRIFYEDGTNAQNRTTLAIREGYDSIWRNITTDENGIGVFNLGTAFQSYGFEFVDKNTNKTLLQGYFAACGGEW